MFEVRYLQSMLIFFILKFDRSILVYSYLFGVCLHYSNLLL